MIERHGDGNANKITVSADKSQVYGLSGNDTLASDGKSGVLLIGGSGDDKLIMAGGNGTLAGGGGSDIFELNYSASKALSAVIEDFVPGEDSIVVNFAGSAAPTTLSSVSGTDVIWSDSTGKLNVTLKGVRENDYFDGTGDEEQDNRFFEILERTNNEREKPTAPNPDHESIVAAANKNLPLPWLTLSDGLTKAASIRAQEITTEFSHSRPTIVGGGSYFKVFNDVGKYYPTNGENIHAGSESAAGAMSAWIGSLSHHKNILSVDPEDDSSVDYQKLGVGYAFVEEGSLSSEEHYYWEQLFGGSLSETETVTVDSLLAAASVISIGTVSAVVTLTEGNDTYSNSVFGATIAALGGNDSIRNSGFNVSINGGADNDTLDNSGSFTTINGGLGNDRINLNDAQSVLIQYKAGDGSDTISGFNASDTFSLSGGEYTPVTVGNDVVVSLGTDSITFTDAAKFSFEEIAGGTRSKHYIGTLGNDSINVTAVNGAIIQPLGGNDTIDGFNSTSTLQVAGGSYTSVASDNDLILSNGTDTINILGAAGSSSINIVDSVGNPVPVEPAKPVNPLLIVGTEGDNTLNNSLDGATIQPLGGNDYVYNNNSRRTVYVYKSGNDTIEGFNDSDRLNIGGYTYESVKIGNDVIISVGTDSITLKDYAEEDVNISTASNPGDSIYNESGNTLVTGTPNDDTITNDGYNVTIDALAGNDSINNNDDEVTILGGAGSDTITDYGNSTISIDGGDGDDYITTTYDYGSEDESTYGSGGTISGGSGNDSVFNYSDDFSIIGGTGDDYLFNNGDNVFVDGGAGDDSIWTSQYEWSVVASATMNGGAGNDAIWNYSDSVTVDGGAGNDSVWSTNSFVSISGGAGSDSIYNDGGDNVTINGGDDGDYIKNTLGDSLIIDAGAGNDTILNDDNANVTMLGGAGNDRISLSADSQNNLVRYTLGDGNDTVWGISENDTLNLPLDAELNPANSRLTSLKNAQGDLIIRVRRNDNNEITGSIILVGAADHPPKITYGESNTSGGGSVGNDNGGSSQGNGGNSSGGQSGGNTSGGTSSNEGRESAASGGRSASGSSGRSSSSNVSSGGNSFRYTRNEHSTTANATTATTNTIPEAVAQLNHQTTANATQTTSTTSTQRVYTGGNQVIGDYTSGERIVFGATYTGAFYDGNGNFFAGSTTGALVVQNATDKVVDLGDAAGNDFVKAYAATTAGIIDGRGLGGFEVINGSAGADAIYAGDGGSQLWGGADVASDAMMGGGGTDIFIGGKNQGADYFLNASSADIVHLNDSTLSDIVATAEENGTIGIAFNTGNVVAVQSSEALSATVMLADGSAYRFNHANKSWQSA